MAKIRENKKKQGPTLDPEKVSMSKEIKLYPRKKRHFRGHKDYVKGQIKYHPNYVFGETSDKYYSYGITEEKKYDKSHNNHPLTKNPKKNCKSPAYIHKKDRSDIKGNYSSVYTNYQFCQTDKDYIDEKIDKKYKKEESTPTS